MKNCTSCNALNGKSIAICWRCGEIVDPSAYDDLKTENERLAAAIGEVIHYVENTKCGVDSSGNLVWYNYKGNLGEIDHVEIPVEHIIKLIASARQQTFNAGDFNTQAAVADAIGLED